MHTNNINELIERLQTVRISGDRAVQRIAREIEGARVQEVAILQQIREARATAENNSNNPQYDRENLFVVGDEVRITNRFRNEFSIVGIVTTSGRRFVEICTTSGKRYTRAYWNLERHIRAGNDEIQTR